MWTIYCEEAGSGAAIATTSLGEEDGLCRTTDWYGKVRDWLMPISTSKREEEEKGEQFSNVSDLRQVNDDNLSSFGLPQAEHPV